MKASSITSLPFAPRLARTWSAGPIGRIWTRYLRPITVVALIGVTWQALRPWELQAAMMMPAPVRLSSSEKALESFSGQLGALRAASRSLGSAKAGELVNGLASLGKAWERLEVADRQVRADLEAVRAHVEAAGLSPEIRARQREMESQYRADFERLKGLVEAVEGEARAVSKQAEAGEASPLTGFNAGLTALGSFLDQKITPPRHQAFDPQQLPHRATSASPRAPRLVAAEFGLPAEALMDKATSAPVVGLSQRASLPTPADLAPTLDAPINQEIRDLAASLGNHPLRLFEFVRNQIEFSPTRGSIQGAIGCLRTRLCNATDSASLLIALLRAAGVPARYAQGTIEVPVEKVRNWVGGFSSSEAALNFVASAGTPVIGLNGGDGLVAARMEHVWVEAYLDFVPSGGAGSGTPGDTWVPLDPSFKQYTYTRGIDLAAATDVETVPTLQQLFDVATVADPDGGVTTIDVATMQSRYEEARADIEAYIDTQGQPPSVTNLAGGRAIVAQAFGVAPGSLPYKVLTRAGQVAVLPDAQRHRLRFEVFADERFAFTPDLSFEATLPELAAKRLTLSYAPASAADEATLLSFVPPGGDPATFPSSLPSYLVRVKPELRLEGAVVATGDGVTLGRTSKFRMTFRAPGEGPRVVDNALAAGTYNAVVLNLGRPEADGARAAAAQALRARIEAGNLTGLTKDDVVGEMLHGAGLLYWAELELASRLTASQQGVVTARVPSEGIFSYDLSVSFLFGTPRTVRSGALITDVDSDVQAIGALDGDRAKGVDFLSVGGTFASAAESAIWDQTVSETPTGRGITAISYIEAAVRQGIPLYHIDQSNVSRALGDLQVSSAVKADIANSVAAGRIVTIPQREFAKDGFTGVGYVVFDPETGAAGYLISGGLAGGGFQLPPLDPLLTFLLGVLLVGLGIFASGGIAVLLAVLGIALIAYDTISTIQGLDPNLSPTARDLIVGFLVTLAIVGAVLAVIGIFAGSVLGFVVFAVYWAFLSVLAANILIALATLADSRGRSLVATRSRRDEEVVALASPPGWPALALA